MGMTYYQMSINAFLSMNSVNWWNIQLQLLDLKWPRDFFSQHKQKLDKGYTLGVSLLQFFNFIVITWRNLG